jgi:hypothetical protein
MVHDFVCPDEFELWLNFGISVYHPLLTPASIVRCAGRARDIGSWLP